MEHIFLMIMNMLRLLYYIFVIVIRIVEKFSYNIDHLCMY